MFNTVIDDFITISHVQINVHFPFFLCALLQLQLLFDVCCGVLHRAYKTVQEEDLKFPLIFGEGKKVRWQLNVFLLHSSLDRDCLLSHRRVISQLMMSLNKLRVLYLVWVSLSLFTVSINALRLMVHNTLLSFHNLPSKCNNLLSGWYYQGQTTGKGCQLDYVLVNHIL